MNNSNRHIYFIVAALFVLLLFIFYEITKSAVTISSLPYTCNQADSTYVLSGNLTCNNGDAITITAANITIEGGGDTIWFNLEDSVGTTVSNGVWGLFLNDVDGCVVESLTIIEDTAADSDGGWVQGIRVGGNNKFTLTDCNVHVRSDNSMGVYSQGCTMFLIDGGNYTSYVTGYNNRMTFTVDCIKYECDAPNQNTDSAYNIKVTDINIDSCPHVGVHVQGKSIIEYCTLMVDAHNEKYTYPSPDTASSSNAFAIMQDEGAGYVRVHHNIITSGTNHYGGRGIACGDRASWADDYFINRIDSNTINTHRGFAESEGWGLSGYGIRVREYTRTDSLYIHDNNISVEANNSQSDSSTGVGAIGIAVSAHGTGYRIYNNHVVVYADTLNYGNGVSSGQLYAFVAEIGNVAGDTDNILYDNYFESNGSVVKMPTYNGATTWGQGDGLLFLRDTFNWTTPNYTDGYSGMKGCIVLGYQAAAQDSILFQDIIFTGDDSVYIDVGQAYTREGQFIRSVKFFVYDSTGYLSNGAAYMVFNDSGNGDTVISGTTGADGLIQGNVTYRFEVWDGNSHEDTTAADYNSVKVRAIKANDTVWATLWITDTTQTPGDSVTTTLTFTNLMASSSIKISGVKLGVSIK